MGKQQAFLFEALGRLRRQREGFARQASAAAQGRADEIRLRLQRLQNELFAYGSAMRSMVLSDAGDAAMECYRRHVGEIRLQMAGLSGELADATGRLDCCRCDLAEAVRERQAIEALRVRFDNDRAVVQRRRATKELDDLTAARRAVESAPDAAPAGWDMGT